MCWSYRKRAFDSPEVSVTPALEKAFDEIRSAWRFRWFGVAAAFVVALIGWCIVFALPDRYETIASVFVDTRTALKPALKNLTVDQDVDAQINYVRQSLLARPQLEKIATDTGVLPATVTDERERLKILSKLVDNITLTVSSAGNQGDERSTAGTIYSIDYLDSSPRRSMRVVEVLLNTFVEQTLGGKREGSENVQKFLGARIKDYEQRLSAAEERIAAFKKQNVGLMPSEQGGYFTQLQNEVDAGKKANTELSVALSRKEELTRQLHGDEAISAAGSSAPSIGAQGVTNGSDTLTRIQETEAKLDELLLRFTDMHPDVISTRATLEELKKRRAQELESLRRGDASAVASSGAGKNPVYQSIQLELNKVGVEIAALRRESEQHENTVAELRKRLNSAPQVEAEYQQLNRDYDVNKAEYTALLENFQKARLGEQADTAGSVRFEIVQPPEEPLAPVWPRRTRLLALIWLAALGVGCGVAYGLHMLRPVVNSVRGVGELTSFPVLGAVSVAFPSRQQFLFRRHLWRFSAATLSLVVAFAIALVLNWSGIRLTLGVLKTLVKT
jgi:polysaccharide chain length determinant protein (PEP-CTERM system associated)